MHCLRPISRLAAPRANVRFYARKRATGLSSSASSSPLQNTEEEQLKDKVDNFQQETHSSSIRPPPPNPKNYPEHGITKLTPRGLLRLEYIYLQAVSDPEVEARVLKFANLALPRIQSYYEQSQNDGNPFISHGVKLIKGISKFFKRGDSSINESNNVKPSAQMQAAEDRASKANFDYSAPLSGAEEMNAKSAKLRISLQVLFDKELTGEWDDLQTFLVERGYEPNGADIQLIANWICEWVGIRGAYS